MTPAASRLSARSVIPFVPKIAEIDMTESASLESLVREMSAKIEGLDLRITETRQDAREARDAATRLTERIGAQDMPTKLAELRGDMGQQFQAIRTDLVNSYDRVRTESKAGFEAVDKRFQAAEDRLEKLEALRDRIEGATGFMGWLARHAPWLLVALMTGLAALGFKDKLP